MSHTNSENESCMVTCVAGDRVFFIANVGDLLPIVRRCEAMGCSDDARMRLSKLTNEILNVPSGTAISFKLIGIFYEKIASACGVTLHTSQQYFTCSEGHLHYVGIFGDELLLGETNNVVN